MPTQTSARAHAGIASAAMAYASGEVFGRRVAVLPLAPNGKTPMTRRGHLEASDDPEVVAGWWRRWPQANLGLALQANGLCCVDLDGAEGLRTWSRLDARYPGPPTCASETGGGGGHLIYAVPEGRRPRGTVGVFPSIDLRGPGYLVVPPSVHPNGTTYRWGMPPWRLPPQPAPEWVLEPLKIELPAVTVSGPLVGAHTVYGRAALEGIIDEVASAPEGTRNTTLYACARRVLDLAALGDVDLANALEVLTLAAARTGLTAHEIQRTIDSAQVGANRVA